MTTKQSSQIEISIDGMQLPIPRRGTDIASLTVKGYFLPSNARWMAGVARLSGLNLIDKNSSPWRMFSWCGVPLP